MAEKQIPVHKKRARARYGVLENLSKPYIQRKFRRLAGIGRLGTRRPLKRPSLIAGSAAAQEALERLVARGPPGGSGISAEAWRSWHRSGFIVCPASKRPHACSNHRCRMGADCRELRALGLRGNRSPLPRKERPAGRSRHRARCARAGTAERCLRRLSAKKYELLDIEKMLSQAATFSV